jgi:hypothetical protein
MERMEGSYSNVQLIKRTLETFSWVKESIDGCIDHHSELASILAIMRFQTSIGKVSRYSS